VNSVGRMAKPRSPKGRTIEVARRLAEEYPDAECELDHRNAFELLAATILSAQTTDTRVNMVTPILFRRYPTAVELAAANPSDVEEIIRSTGFYQNKTKSLIGMAQALLDRFDGEVPTRLEDLVTLPGVGRKTGNVVRSVAFDSDIDRWTAPFVMSAINTRIVRRSNALLQGSNP